MRSCTVTINNDHTVDVGSVSQYIGEHAATQLEIALNDELCAESISYYTLSFNTGSGLANPCAIKFSSDAITADSAYGYVLDGVIYFVLPKALTLFSMLEIQVEAHTEDEGGSITETIKSPVFDLTFGKSVCGEETVIPEKGFEIIEEMRKALNEMNAVTGEIAAIREEIDAIYGTVDEIEEMINESGVLV